LYEKLQEVTDTVVVEKKLNALSLPKKVLSLTVPDTPTIEPNALVLFENEQFVT
jgi:hypothetical protein